MVPDRIGLCPGEHLEEFYVPLDEDSYLECPMCDRIMLVYALIDPPPKDD